MKKLSTLRAAALLLTCTSLLALDASAQLLQQDFSTNTTVATYVNATTPTNGQWNALSSSGAGTVVSINATGSNKLRFARAGANAGAASRTTDFSPTPGSLMYRFDLTVSGNSASQTTAAAWQVGSGFGTANSSESNANTYARIGLNWTTTAGQFSIRDLTGGTNSANYTGTQTITWVMNNSGATMTYRAPDGTQESIANDKSDVWVGSTREFNDVNVESPAQTMTDLKFSITAGTGTVDMDNFLIDPIPAIPTSAAASPINPNDFQANWSTVAGVTGYSIDVATDAGFTSFVSGYNNLYVAGQATTSVSVTGLAPSTPYWYRVRGTSQYTVGSFSGGNSGTQNPTTSAGVNTTVQFAAASATVSEGVGTYNVTVNITNPSGSQATGVDVVLVSGNAARINGFSSQTISFPTGSSTPINVTITVTDNATCGDGDEVLTFALQNLTGGQGTPTAGANRTLTVQNNDSPVAPTAIAATGVGYGDFTANWNSVSGATNYRLDVYTQTVVFATDLFISEYVEGSSNNKYIEVYNGTGASVNLGDYRLRLYANGAGAPTTDVLLSGTLANGATIVYANGSAVAYGGTVVANAAVNYNGDDALALFKVSSAANVDIIGRIGEDPGTEWTAAGGRSTLDKTLVRKASVMGGVTANPGAGFPTLLTEWDVFNQDDVSHLGAHTFNGTTLNYVPGYQNFDAGTNTSQSVTGLSPLTTYYYVVRSTGGCSTGTNSNEISVSTSAVPTYYSRATGNVTDPIWSDTPGGVAGPANFTSASNMVVQAGHVVTNTANATIKSLTIDASGTLVLNASTTLDVKGATATITGTLTANDNSNLSMTEVTNSTLAITGTVSFFDFTAAPATAITVTGGMDIRGTLQLNNGVFDASGATVALRSTATYTGRLGPVDPGASYTGNLKVERYVPGGATNWRLLGSPVAGRTVAAWQDDFITAGYPGSQFPNFDDPPGSNILWPSVRWYDEPNTGTLVNDGLVGVSSSAQSLAQGQGFAAWSGDALGGTAAFIVDLNGNPNVANTPITLPMSWTDTSTPAVDGWNLVSNPVASPILFSSISRGADVGDFITYYNPAAGNTATYDISLNLGTNGGTNVIQSSQGFFLKATGSGVTTTVSESAKTNNNGGGFFGGDEVTVASALHLKMTSAINAYNDETVVLFSAGTPAVDAEDAMKYVFGIPSAPQIATFGGNNELIAINAYGAYNTAISIPVMVNAGVTGTYTVTATGIETLGLTCISLEDLLTGTITPLTEGASYNFEMEADADASVPRLMLHATAPLPFAAQDATCGGQANGQATVTINEGPVDVTWTDAVGAVLLQQNGISGDATFGGLAAGTYAVHVTTNSVCGELVSEFTIDAPFVLEAAALGNAPTTCGDTEDGTVDVMVMGGVEPYTYAWSNGADSEDLLAGAGTYTLTVTDANNCVWNSDVYTIAAGGPTAGFTVSPSVLVNTDVLFTNTSTAGETYFWQFGDGGTSTEVEPTYVYTLPGTYTVTLTVTSGDCSAVTTFDVTVEMNTGIAVNRTLGLNAWVTPNGFVVEHNFTKQPVLIDVLDATGRIVLQRQVAATPGRVILSSEGLSSGIWFVRVSSGDTQQTFRLPLLR